MIGPHPTSPPRSCKRPALALGFAALVPLGVLLMRQPASPSWLPMPAIGLLSRVSPNSAWVLLGSIVALAGCLGAFWLLPPILPSTEAAAPDDAGLRFSGRRPLWALGALAVAAGLYGWVLVAAHDHGHIPWLLAALPISLVLISLALRALTRPAAPDPLPRWVPGEYLFVGAAVLAFTAFNQQAIRDWHFVFWGDEWPFYDAARAIALGVGADPFSQAGVFGIHPLADSIYQAVVMRLTDMHALGWRLSSTLAAALPIIPLYALGRRLGGAPQAAIAVVIYAACPLLWAFARIGYNNNDPLFFMALSAALCYAGQRRGSAVLLFAAGTVAGGAWYSLFSGRLMIGVVGLAVLLDWRGGARLVIRRLAFLLGGFVLAVLPLLIDNGDQTIRQMFPLINISQARTTGSMSSLLGDNTVRGIYAFFYATENSHYVQGAVFDVLSAGLLCLGMVLAVRRVHHGGVRLVLIWFAVGLLLTTPLYYAPQIADTRLMIAIAPAALLAAWGLRAVLCVLGHLLPRTRPLVPGLALAGVLAGILGLNLYQFDGVMLPARNAPYPTADLVARALLATPNAVFVLPADLNTIDPNGALCDIVESYRIDPARVLYPDPSGLRVYCSLVPGALPAPAPTVLVLRDGQGHHAGCTAPPSATYVDRQARVTVQTYRLTMPILPPAAYLDVLTLRLGALCPHLSG